jgi:hypothetical protein
LEDLFGAAAAAILVKHAMDHGVIDDNVQCKTICRMKSAFLNVYQISVENESTSIIGGKKGKKQLTMGTPFYHGWYDPPQVGMHHHMGDKVAQGI